MSGGIPVLQGGIALGRRSIAAVQDQYELVPGSYAWLHEYRGPNPHPVHEGFAGETFNGDYILFEGSNFYPGDHGGCVCSALIQWKAVGT